MNEFIEQFLVESRELVETATHDLLALEHDPRDAERLDRTFRAFHTLKGGAGIVEFTAMAQVMHAAEDVLAAARAGTRPLTPALVGDCLHCLDQVVQWLDGMQDDELPAGAEATAAILVARLAPTAPGQAFGRAEPSAASGDWVSLLQEKYSSFRPTARTAIRYTPDSDCFFRGEDPIALLAEVPDLLAVEIEPVVLWPALERLDPYACGVVLTALAKSSPSEAASILGKLADQVEIVPIGAAIEDTGVASGLTPAARAVLEAQVRLLAVPDERGAQGRSASAARSAINTLRHLGMEAPARSLEGETEAPALAAAIGHILDDRLPAVADKAAADRVLHEGWARTLRVDALRVDALVDLTGELIVAKNAIGHTAKLAAESGSPLAAVLKEQHAQFDHLVGELQKSVLNLRVLPLRGVFQRFPRLIREMSARLARPARLVTEGDDTEADKVIVEALYEPLLHVLRNAMDHGVETAQQRTAAGKAATATISLRASREGENVIVEVADDGRGVDLAKVRQIAIERGVVSAEAAASFTDADVRELIFSPGFSTASEITHFSGRGVGMDAVRSAVGRLGGQVSIQSRDGQGSVVRFVLPFSVMVTPVVTVAAAGQMFGVPLDTVFTVVRIARKLIFPVGASHAFVLRDRTVPVIDLAETLDRHGRTRCSLDATLVIVSIAGQSGALEVDSVGERMDVLLKPVKGLLSGIPAIAGTTVLGDGTILLVLDVQELLS